MRALAIVVALAACAHHPEKAPPGPPPPRPPPAAPRESPIPAECAQLIAVYEKFASCPQLPAESRDQMHAAIETMKTGWDTADEERRKAGAEACKTAEPAAHDSMQAIGCE